MCSGFTTATYSLSDFSLKYDAILDKPNATTVNALYAGTAPIPFTQVTSIHHVTLSKKDTNWNIDIKNMSIFSLQSLLSLFLDKCDDFANKNKKVCNLFVKRVLETTNGIFYQIFLEVMQTRGIYLELKKYVYKKHSNVMWEEFLAKKFGQWINVQIFVEVVKQWKKSSILL